MSDKTLGTLVVRIGSDVTGLLKGTQQAQTSMQKMGTTAAASTKMLAGAALAAATAVVGLALKGVQLGDAMAEAADKMGLAAGELSALRYAAKFAGIEAGALDGALVRLGKSVADAAHGNKEMNDTLAQLGLSAEELRKLPLDEQMLSVSAAMEGVTNQTEKLRIASQLFGRGAGAQMVAMFKGGTEAIREQMAEATRYGLFIDQTQTRVVSEAADAQDRMKASFEGLSMQLGATFGPAIEAAAAGTAEFIALITSSLPTFQAWLNSIGLMKTAAGDWSDAGLTARVEGLNYELGELDTQMERIRANAQGKGTGQQRDAERWLADLQSQRDVLQAEVDSLTNEARSRTPKGSSVKAGKAGADELFDEDAAREAAAAELALVTAVYAEKERLIMLESEQEADWAQVMFEERERVAAEELEQQQSWADVLAEERDKSNASELDAFLQHQTLLSEAAREGAEARKRFEESASGQKVAHVLGDLERMTAGIAQHSKKAFKVNQLAAIGNAAINTAQGVTKALAEYPPPLSFAMAAAQAAAGAAQISAIKSAKFEGGGQGTTPSAAGSTPTVNSQPASAGPDRIMHVRGIDPSQLFSGRQVAELLNGAVRDGFKLVLNP